MTPGDEGVLMPVTTDILYISHNPTFKKYPITQVVSYSFKFSNIFKNSFSHNFNLRTFSYS